MLKNGARVIADKRYGDRRIVAAEFGRSFVTWRVDPEGNCFWGHYFPTEAEALVDFDARR